MHNNVSNEGASTHFTRRSKSVVKHQSVGMRTPMLTPIGKDSPKWKGPRELHYLQKSPKFIMTGKAGKMK